MASKSKVSYRDDHFENTQATLIDGYYNESDDGNSMTQSETAQEVVPEIRGTNDTEAAPPSMGTETGEETSLGSHTAVSSPFISASGGTKEGTSDEAGGSDETTDTESSYENVEGWQENTETESEETDAVLEASFADAEASEGGQEFFGALAALLVPMIPTIVKAVAPSAGKIVGGLVKSGAKKLSPQTANLIKKLKSLGINVPAAVMSKLEASEEFSDESSGFESEEESDAAAEAFAKQVESLETIIGKDDRVQVKDTTYVPWKRICHLKIQAANGKIFSGTGFFIGRRTIATAGHCIYLHGQGGWARQISVTPARNGTESSFNTFTSRSFRSVQGWVSNKSRSCDYGVIQLSKTDAVSANIGAFGFAQYTDAYLLNKKLNTAGYPGDKPAGTLWFNGRKAKAVTPSTVIYDTDTMPGQSGSPVWFKRSDGARIVVGIHTNGATSGNSATRIIKPVWDNLNKWRQEAGLS